MFDPYIVSRKGKNIGNSALSTKEVHHLLTVPLGTFEKFENPTSPRRDSEKVVEFQKEILVNFSIHVTHIALRCVIIILHYIKRTTDCK